MLSGLDGVDRSTSSRALRGRQEASAAPRGSRVGGWEKWAVWRSARRSRDDSLRARVRSTLDENKRLREEIVALRQELALAHGRVRESERTGRARGAA